MVNQYPCDANLLTFRDSGIQGRTRIAVVLHTDESGFDYAARRVRSTAWTADQLAEYNRSAPNDPNRGSYHIGVDRKGRAVRQNDDPFSTWSVGSDAGNSRCFHACFTGTAYQSNEDWLSYPEQMERMADIVAFWCKEYDIPARRITADDLKAGRKGICGHGDCSVAFGGSDHWDPGGYGSMYPGRINGAGGFPWNYFISLVKARLDGKPTTPITQGESMNASERQALDDVRQQLTGSRTPGEYAGWPQLNGRTLVDAVAEIGAKLGLDGYQPPRKA